MKNLFLPLLIWATASTPAAADSSLSWVTKFGGSQFERAQGVAVDQQGFVYITGNTGSPDLPTTPGVFQRSQKTSSSDAYVAKLSPNGDRLIWATYIGGSRDERGYDLVVDALGYVYVSIWTTSSDFPTTAGAFDRTIGSNTDWDQAFVKLAPDASHLVYSTYVGGSGLDQSRNSIYVDSTGALYSSGLTTSTDFPVTPGAYQTTHAGGVEDAYLLKLNPAGSALVFATYLGGTNVDSGFTKVKVHSDGSIYFGGVTSSTDFPVTTNAFQRVLKGQSDGFVVRFDPTGSRLIYSTYLGGSGIDNVSPNDSVTVDSQGQAVVIGSTFSTDFPTSPNAYQRVNPGAPTYPTAYVTKLSHDGSSIIASTLFGGSRAEEGSGIELDSSGFVYFGGNTESTDLPVTSNATQRNYRGGAANTDGFYGRLTPDLSTLLFATYFGGSGTTGGFGDRVRSVTIGPNNAAYIAGDTNSSDMHTTAGAFDSSFHGVADSFVARFVRTTTPTDTTAPNAPTNFR